MTSLPQITEQTGEAHSSASFRFSADTGGTFTDLIVESAAGALQLFKAPTDPVAPVRGILAAFDLAATAFGLDRGELLAQGRTFVHGTTHAINAVVTRKTAKTALLVTAGHPDILVLREGGRLEPFNHTVRFPPPYIPRAWTFEVAERILADGTVFDPLGEISLVELLRTLRAREVEAIAVSLLWSVINPVHELRVGRLIEEHLPGVPYTLSHQLNPSIREYRRSVATAIDASLKPLMNRYLTNLESEMRQAGFRGQLWLVTSQGSMVDVATLRQSPILALKSGPSMAPLAGKWIARKEADERDTVIFDTGGTTFDVSLVRDGRIPYTQETWLGRPYQSDMTGFPSVDVRSVGAGGGSIAWVDTGGVLHVGPQSAGSVPGPACYGKGGVLPTVTDAAVVLGFIDPGFFLGGRITLDPVAARAVIEEHVARPLNLSLEDAASSILSVWTENMVQAINDITINQGIDTASAVLVAGGGAAGLNAVAIARRLASTITIIPTVAAGLSAAGAIVSDIGRDFRRVFVTSSKQLDRDRIRETLAYLEERARSFASQSGAAEGSYAEDYVIEARYAHQVWEIDVPIAPQAILGNDGERLLAEAFHRTHERVFGFRDERSTVEIIAWRVSVRLIRHDEVELRLQSRAAPRESGERQVYFAGHGWIDARILSFDGMDASEDVRGPAIIESAFTSAVIDSGATATRTLDGNLIVRFDANGAWSPANSDNSGSNDR
ncbi:hydantoinase/oxoprolinase family protein [Pseudochelatococcus sp. B33]